MLMLSVHLFILAGTWGAYSVSVVYLDKTGCIPASCSLLLLLLFFVYFIISRLPP